MEQSVYLRVCQVSAVCFLAQPSGPHRVTQRCVRATHSVYPLNAAHVTVSGAGFDQNHGQNTPHMYRCREVSPRPRERAVIHTSAVWFGQGWAVWISHPGQVGDRAGQGTAVVRQYAAEQDHKQSGQVGC